MACIAIVVMLGLAAPAVAAPPAITVKAAKQLRCTITDRDASYVGPTNSGVECVRGGVRFTVLQYKNPKRAMKYWRNWTDGYLARDGKLFVIVGKTRATGDHHSLEDAQYAAKRIGGRVVEF